MGGKYLDRCRVARPGSLPESPTYYGPQDFYIGAVVDIFRKRFVIIDADYYVLKYIEEHEHQFPGQNQPSHSSSHLCPLLVSITIQGLQGPDTSAMRRVTHEIFTNPRVSVDSY